MANLVCYQSVDMTASVGSVTVSQFTPGTSLMAVASDGSTYAYYGTMSYDAAGNAQGTISSIEATAATGAKLYSLTGLDLSFAAATSGSPDSLAFVGNDLLYGSSGADALVGYDGNDFIYGGMGADVIKGGNGNDTLTGGLGNDTLAGGDGSDTFVLGVAGSTAAATADIDTLQDFSAYSDFLAVATLPVSVSTLTPGKGGATDAVSAARSFSSYLEANQAAVFAFGSDTYLFVGDGVAGLSADDCIVKITGYAGAIGLSNFVLAS